MRKITSLFIYIILVIMFPNGIGIEVGFELRIWMFLAIVFLFPPFISFNMNNHVMLNNTNFLIIGLILLSTIRHFILLPPTSAIVMMINAFLYFFLPYFAGKYFIKNEKDLMNLFYILSIAAIIQSLIVFYEFQSGVRIFTNFRYMLNPEDYWNNSQMNLNRHGGLFRGYASFVHPIYLGTYLFLITLCNSLIFIYQKSKVTKHFKLLLFTQIILGIVAGMFSQSRSAIVSFILVFTFIFILDNKKNNMFRVLLMFLPIILLIVYLIINNYYKDYFNTFMYTNIMSDDADMTLKYRYNITISTFKYIFKYPNLFGEKLIYSSDLKAFIKNDLTNGVLNKFVHVGIFYGILYVYIYFKSLKESYRYRTYCNWGIILFSIFLYLFIVDNFSGIGVQNEILFYIFLGILFNPFLRNQWKTESGLHAKNES